MVGAGSAGASLAGHLARAGREVVLIDRRPRGATGARWVNGVPAWMFDVAGVPAPKNEELFKHGGAFVMRPLGARTTVAHRGSGDLLHVDMRHLVDRLVDGAVDSGARFVVSSVRGVTVEKNEATLHTDGAGGASATLRARLVVDASGLGAVVRRTCGAPGMAARVDRHDVCGAAQYQFEVTRKDALAEWLLEHDAVPGDDVAIPGVAGGYSTLTLFTRAELDEVGVLAGSIPSLGVDNGAQLVRRFVAEIDWLGEQTFGGRGAIPVRRPLSHLRGPRVALVGDAACQVYGTHGSGVGIGLIAARLLADSVALASDPGAAASLADYERRFLHAWGGLLTASDTLRRFAQRSPPELAAAALDAGLIDDEIFSAALLQRPIRPSLRSLRGLVWRSARSPLVAARFGPAIARALASEQLGRYRDSPIASWLVGHDAIPDERPRIVNPLTDSARESARPPS